VALPFDAGGLRGEDLQPGLFPALPMLRLPTLLPQPSPIRELNFAFYLSCFKLSFCCGERRLEPRWKTDD
jgi:hypothetical protein